MFSAPWGTLVVASATAASMSSREFATPVFRGGRFDAGALPLDVLPDLAAYRDLIVELAKALFLAREPGRRRVPKGFVESFQIGIRAVNAGSTIAVLERTSVPGGMLTLFPKEDLFDEARNLIDKVVAAAGQKAPLPPEFPHHLAMRFNQFGRSLRDGESVELRGPGATSGPTYDRGTRKWIVVQAEGRYEDGAELTGVVSGGVLDREQITVRLDDGALVDGRCSAELVRQTLALLDRKVRVVGLGSFDRNDHLERLLRVDDVAPIDEDEAVVGAPSALGVQFGDLASLPAGWFETETPPLDRTGLKTVEAFLTAVVTSGVPVPHLYPTPDAGVRAEWTLGTWEVSATFELGGACSAHLHATQVTSDSTEDADVGLDAADALSIFSGFVRQFLAPGAGH